MMANPYHKPNPGAHNKAENNTSASVSSRGEMTDKAKSEIKETFTPGKNYDAEMEAKFGKEPNQQDVVAQFASQEKFKGKGFEEILTQLEQDDNKPMADRLKKKLAGKGWSKQMSDKEEDKALAAAGYTKDEVGIKPIDEKAKKKIEANKSEDMKGFTPPSKEKLQVGDIVIAQTGITGESPTFRLGGDKKSYTGVNYSKFPTEEARMQELKKLFKRHEVTENDLKGEEKKEEKKVEAPKVEAPKPEAPKVEKEEKKPEAPKVEAIKEGKKAEKKEGKGGFLKRTVKGTGKVIARPFKKGRQAIKRPFGKSEKNKDKKGIQNTRIGRTVTRPFRKSRDIVSGVGGHARGTVAGAVKYQRGGAKKFGSRLVKPFKRKSK